MLCDFRQQYIRVSLLKGDDDSVWLASRPIFTIALMELLKRHARFASTPRRSLSKAVVC